MRSLGPPELLTLWERGAPRHPVDRAVLLFAVARPDLSADALPDLPLGFCNQALLGLRRATFGPCMQTYVDCPRCDERLEMTLDADTFVADVGEPDVGSELELSGYRFRPPSNRDVAAITDMRDPDLAAVRLLERCCVARPADEPLGGLNALLEAVESGLESLDPGADLTLALDCEACGHVWQTPFDIASLLWDEIETRAHALLGEVDRVARAYGWSERDILALGERRRAAYLALLSV